jgi:hypothetical protein
MYPSVEFFVLLFVSQTWREAYWWSDYQLVAINSNASSAVAEENKK